MSSFAPAFLSLALTSLLLTTSVQAEPSLPGGLGQPSQQPALPEEMSQGDWPTDDADWDFDENPEDPSTTQAGLTGFVELRSGQRLTHNKHQRDTSLGELRLELAREWQYQQGSAKLTANLIHDEVEDNHRIKLETGQGWLDLREAWWQHRLGEQVEIKAGRQILTWGVGDLVFINDLFPKDWNSFLAGRDEQFLKSPSDAIKLGFYAKLINLNLVYTPRFDSDRFIDGRRLSYFSPLSGQLAGREQLLQTNKPQQTGSDDELALRLYRNVGSYEVALYGYQGFWKSPGGFDPRSGQAVFPRLRVIGASARGPFGTGILSLEAGYYHSLDDRRGNNPFINNDEFRLLVGYEWELMSNTTVGVQYYLEALQDYDRYRSNLPAGQTPRDEHRQLATVRLTRLAMNQNLTLSLFLFWSPTDQDMYLRPKAHYKVTDNWAVEAGVNWFNGDKPHTFFGQFEDNRNAYLSVRYSF